MLTIRAFDPLPDFGRRFDVVTAFAVCFNNHDRPDLWGPAEVFFYLKDLATIHLTPDGRLLKKLNPDADETYCRELLASFFRAHDGFVEG